MKNIIQLLKFAVVGISNTLITAATIWVLLKGLHISDYIANIVGYIFGLANSFIWNRRWTFSSKASINETLFKFLLTFVISYLFQLANLYILLNYTTIDSYLCQLLSIVLYTCINFISNKYYTFINK